MAYALRSPDQNGRLVRRCKVGFARQAGPGIVKIMFCEFLNSLKEGEKLFLFRKNIHEVAVAE